MKMILNMAFGFICGVYATQKYNIPCLEGELYKLVKEIEKRKK
jgi:hypothetical protein